MSEIVRRSAGCRSHDGVRCRGDGQRNARRRPYKGRTHHGWPDDVRRRRRGDGRAQRQRSGAIVHRNRRLRNRLSVRYRARRLSHRRAVAISELPGGFVKWAERGRHRRRRGQECSRPAGQCSGKRRRVHDQGTEQWTDQWNVGQRRERSGEFVEASYGYSQHGPHDHWIELRTGSFGDHFHRNSTEHQ